MANPDPASNPGSKPHRLSDKMQSLHLGTKQQTVAVWLS